VPTELSDLRVVEISLVKRPANRRPLLLLKSEETMPEPIKLEVPEGMLPVIKSALEAGKGEDETLAELLKAGLSDDEQNKARMALRLLDGLKGKIPEATMKALAKAAGHTQVETKETPVTKTKLIKSEDGREFTVAEEAAPVVEALLKSEGDLRKSLGDATKKLDAEIGERKQRDALAKAAKDFPHLDPTKTAGLLLKAETVSPEFVADLDLTLKQAEALAASGALKEIGSGAGGGSGGDTWSKIDAGGRDLVQKSGGKMSAQQGVTAFLGTPEGAALHRAYNDERRGAH
jgi:hypothetical protein